MDAVVRTVSSIALVISAIEVDSVIVVATDWIEARDALDPRPALPRVAFLGLVCVWFREKKGQDGALL